MKVTIKDVVKKSGLSYVTVSRVISNDPNVREENRRKVMEAIEVLGYVPNAAARTLATGKTGVIAMFITNMCDDFYASIIKEVNEQLQHKGYLLTLSICDDHKNESNTSFLRQHRIDGAIIMVPNKERQYIDLLKTGKVPFVVIDNQTMSEDITSVMTDNVAGGYLAAKHLIELGHTKIGLIGASSSALSTMERQIGAVKALNEASLTPYAIEYGEYDQMTGYDTIMKWNSEGGLPSAVFAFDDHIALGTINAVKDLGLSVPSDLSVCGYDDSVLANSYVPHITSVRQPAEEMARCAVDQLMTMIDDQKLGAYAVKFPPKMAIKESTAPKQ